MLFLFQRRLKTIFIVFVLYTANSFPGLPHRAASKLVCSAITSSPLGSLTNLRWIIKKKCTF